ncbi:hypothetical protein Tco_0822155 [Tanacetum coccineum]|uniref:Uncharacterized protein n=1 Tax=Tanacetum coccineum TaxID=301880 RepID=A0ABQ5AFC9_9ASTR
MSDSQDFFPPDKISPPKDAETPVESPIPISLSSSVRSSSPFRYPERKLLSVPVENDWDNVPDAIVISSSPSSIVDPSGHVDFVATKRSVFDLSFTRLHQL